MSPIKMLDSGIASFTILAIIIMMILGYIFLVK